MFALILLVGLAAIAPPESNPEDPVAVVVQAADGVSIEGTAGSTPATPGEAVLAGDRVVVPEGARAVLLHRTGRTEVVTRTTEPFEATGGSDASGVFARTVRTLRDVGASDARDQPNRQGMIRPIAGAAVAIAPRNEVVVSPDHRTFTWFAVPGAEEYTVQIRREGASPERFTVAGDTVLTLPDDHPGLEPGSGYSWMVGSAPRGRIAPPQRFRVADAGTLQEIEETLSHATADAGSPDAVRFLRVLLLHDAELHYAALDELDTLEATSPDDGDTPRIHTLRAVILDALGDLEGAAESFRRADAG